MFHFIKNSTSSDRFKGISAELVEWLLPAADGSKSSGHYEGEGALQDTSASGTGLYAEQDFRPGSHIRLSVTTEAGDSGEVLLEVTAKGKPLAVGWTIERADGGRAFGTTLGHFHRNFGLVPFRKMLINGIIWSAGLEVPEKGAPCKLDKTDPLFPKG